MTKPQAIEGTRRAPRQRASARPDTRAKILAACRELFNERGPAAVTTAEISAAVHINEGNLYYHFQRKEQILEALFDAFADQLLAVATSHAHRDEAYSASRYAIEQLKARVPIWKREHYIDGTRVWVDPTGKADHVGASGGASPRFAQGDQ